MADYTSTGTFNKKYFNERAFGAIMTQFHKKD